MRLESIARYFSPKSPTLNDSTPATASDSLSISDVMGALGMCQAQAEFGFAAFLGKVGISETDKAKAVVLLAKHAITRCDQIAAIRKLPNEIKARVIFTLAVFAFLDYSRSAASEVLCDTCDDGFIEETKFVMNRLAIAHDETPYTKRRQLPEGLMPKFTGDFKGEMRVKYEYYDTTRKVCPKCNGKQIIKTACNDCRGRGEALDKEESERQGVPVRKPCKRCSGRGYERMPSTQAYRAISCITPSISLDTWKKSVKPFYDEMITHLEIEESMADAALKETTE